MMDIHQSKLKSWATSTSNNEPFPFTLFLTYSFCIKYGRCKNVMVSAKETEWRRIIDPTVPNITRSHRKGKPFGIWSQQLPSFLVTHTRIQDYFRTTLVRSNLNYKSKMFLIPSHTRRGLILFPLIHHRGHHRGQGPPRCWHFS